MPHPVVARVATTLTDEGADVTAYAPQVAATTVPADKDAADRLAVRLAAWCSRWAGGPEVEYDAAHAWCDGTWEPEPWRVGARVAAAEDDAEDAAYVAVARGEGGVLLAGVLGEYERWAG